ncbi:hypothetical protein PVAND_004258 [Polypedilum vanderplanki]|uniref:G-protein coupled receptors family 1 profile domain-containing protein n=1 Tax=Polypedilum vanderplanki TaxID=319348 RepID=A0A9J6BWK8_POLVA|nr:hypothetical protein PVAND_004258 [Polypedilum vanderplanki]
MAHITRISFRTIYLPRSHLLLITFILLSFSKCNETLSKIQSSDKILLQESVVIPSSKNAEDEAKKLYQEALKQYGDLGKTLKEICEPWKTRGCICIGTSEEVTLTCRHVGFKNVPLNLPQELIKLDLGSNNITVLKNHSFTSLPILEELVLSDNRLTTIEKDAFTGLNNLKRLVLQNCDLIRLPIDAFESIKSLTSLNLANNRLTQLDNEDFPVIKNLQYLFLKRNKIREISSGVFRNLAKLKVLDLDDNQLESLSSIGLKNLTQLQELMLSNNKIMSIENLPLNLVTLELRANPLRNFHESAIKNLKRLKKLVLSDSRHLKELPSFEGCASLETLRVDHADLSQIPEALCTHSPRLKSLELKFNKLRHVPNLKQCYELRLLNLASNKISSLHNKPFENLSQLHDLLIPYNQIETIPLDAFSGLKRLQTLDLEGNNINFIHEQAFSSFTQLEDLNLGENIFPTLPTDGLQRLLHLKTFNNPRLRIFPPIEAFPRIRTLVLSYAYHCCAFLPLLTSNRKVIGSPYKEEVFFPTDEKFDMSMWNNSINDIWPDLNINFTSAFHSQMDDILQSYSNPYADFGYPSITNYPENDMYNGEESSVVQVQSYETNPMLVKCLPTPGPFLPCEDLFDWWTLRCGVWVVFLLALLGNGIVVFVLIFSRSKMDVPRFLVCNLAAADFFMGIYLGFLAVIDASTLGEFRMYAIRWQMSVGCQLSGFLAVFSSELSVYTLAVITLERNYAITHAMHLNKRLSLRHASYIMSIGWIFALTMAVLPLFGVSDYRKYSVCLPMEVYKGYGSLTYVIFLMFINGVAFLTLMGCYLKMYCAIRGSQAWNSNDSRIAKRMALLVFTDFLCWSPIAFFSIATVLGWQLVTLEQAKVFTVFILPLNSCCNPFLYAILTKQFKKDCVMLCKAIEESRVTRGIGRCRHSSNFSNRQTPGNTNSLNERSSRELPPLLPAHVCNCNRGKIIDQEEVKRQLKVSSQPNMMARFWKRLFCSDGKKFERRNHRHMDYSYHIAEIKQKNHHKRAGSMSSSDGNFSSSRSDSWKHGTPHHCGVPLRLLDPRRRHTSWLITRKTSQDSNLSSSRNDSSGSNNTTATTASSTWRISRSNGSNIVIPGLNIPPSFATSNSSRQSLPGSKPRLVRQSAFHDETQEPATLLGVRYLPTIPSAPDSSVQLDDENESENFLVNQECVHLQNQQTYPTATTENSENLSSPQSKPP